MDSEERDITRFITQQSDENGVFLTEPQKKFMVALVAISGLVSEFSDHFDPITGKVSMAISMKILKERAENSKLREIWNQLAAHFEERAQYFPSMFTDVSSAKTRFFERDASVLSTWVNVLFTNIKTQLKDVEFFEEFVSDVENKLLRTQAENIQKNAAMIINLRKKDLEDRTHTTQAVLPNYFLTSDPSRKPPQKSSAQVNQQMAVNTEARRIQLNAKHPNMQQTANKPSAKGITTNDIVSHLVTKDREKEQDLSPDSTVTRATAEQNDPKHQATDKPANEGTPVGEEVSQSGKNSETSQNKRSSAGALVGEASRKEHTIEKHDTNVQDKSEEAKPLNVSDFVNAQINPFIESTTIIPQCDYHAVLKTMMSAFSDTKGWEKISHSTLRIKLAYLGLNGFVDGQPFTPLKLQSIAEKIGMAKFKSKMVRCTRCDPRNVVGGKVDFSFPQFLDHIVQVHGGDLVCLVPVNFSGFCYNKFQDSNSFLKHVYEKHVYEQYQSFVDKSFRAFLP